MKPVSEEDLLPALTLALTRFKQFQALRREVVDLREALEARKVIEKPEGILMRRSILPKMRRSVASAAEPEAIESSAQVTEAIVVADQML